MIKASSLFYAIVISLIIAIVSSSLLLFAYTNRIENDKLEMTDRMLLNIKSGIQLLLSEQDLIPLNNSKEIDLYNKGTDNILLSRKAWGAYEVLISQATFKGEKKTLTALAGFAPDSNRYCIYIADEDKPLSLCGNTLLKGTAYLPKAGVQRAYIEGQNFIGSKLIDGNILLSKKELPEFDKDLDKCIRSILSDKHISENDSIVEVGNELEIDSVNNSFQGRTIVYSSDVSIHVTNGVYKGNIVIISSKQIKISSEALLQDVIVAAPKIILEKGCKGNLQAFASDSIIVEKDVSLDYPSVLGIVKNKLTQTSIIILNENDSVSGNVFSVKKEDDIKNTGILIKKDAYIKGQVYTNGYADEQGTIAGSLTCRNTLLQTSASVYEDHLLNATIDESKLSAYFAGISLVKESTKKAVIKYLK
ncbi:MAG: hypothetical protein ACXVPU_06515 [Bacteroidia bacterium]